MKPVAYKTTANTAAPVGQLASIWRGRRVRLRVVALISSIHGCTFASKTAASLPGPRVLFLVGVDVLGRRKHRRVHQIAHALLTQWVDVRSEERRVGKECR